jgi:hypothetical protein
VLVTCAKAAGPVSQAEMAPFRLVKIKCAEPPLPPFPNSSSSSASRTANTTG